MGLDFSVHKIRKVCIPQGYKRIHGTLSNETINILAGNLRIEDFYLSKPYHLLDYFKDNLVSQEAMNSDHFYYNVNLKDVKNMIKYITPIFEELNKDLFSDDWECSKYRDLLKYLYSIEKNWSRDYVYIFEFDW